MPRIGLSERAPCHVDAPGGAAGLHASGHGPGDRVGAEDTPPGNVTARDGGFRQSWTAGWPSLAMA